MKNTGKVGILIGLLVVPALIFLFLRFMWQNHFDLPYKFPKTNDNGEVIIQNGDTVYHQIPKFALIDQNGKPFTSAQTEGKVYVADFFFTRCGTICPKLSKALTRVQEDFQNNEDVLIVSHTVDPNHDTAEVLKNYAKQYDAKEGKWFFLTESKAKMYDVILNGYMMSVADSSMLRKPEDAFVHTEKLLLIDKKGYIRGWYDGTNGKDVERLMTEIDILLGTYKSK
jgi:protein SCO1